MTPEQRITTWMHRHGMDPGGDPVATLLARCEVLMIHEAKRKAAERPKQPVSRVWNDELEAALIEIYNSKPALSLPRMAHKMGFEDHQIRTKIRILQRRGLIQKRR